MTGSTINMVVEGRMFGFLKQLFVRRAEQQDAAREKVSIAALVEQHRSGVMDFIAKAVPPPVVKPPQEERVNTPGHLREGMPPPPKPTFVEEVSTKRCVGGGGERKPNASRDDVHYSVSAERSPSSELRANTLYKARSRKPISLHERASGETTKEPPALRRFSVESLYEVAEHLPKPEKTFVEKLHDYLRASSDSHAQIYKAAQIDRRLFSKIISDAKYKPSRDVAFALCLALNLTLEQTKDLIARAGYALSKSSKRDLALEYCFANKVYDLLVVNGILHELGEDLL